MSSPFSRHFTPSNILLTFDVFPKTQFCCLFNYTLFWGGKQGVQTAPASSILNSSLRSLFSWLPPFSIFASKTVDIKTCIFLEHKFAAFVFKLQAPVVQKVTNAMHWINLSIKRIVQLVSLILHVLWITIFPVDKQLEPVSQS